MNEKQKFALLETVRVKLDGFAKLERRNTDEVGWIMLGLGVSRRKAASLIEEARAAAPPVEAAVPCVKPTTEPDAATERQATPPHDSNAFPDGWREIAEADFARSAYFSQVPEKHEYRQMLAAGTSDPAKLDLTGRELYMCATLYSYADKTGIALVSEHERGRVRFFAFGCPHEFHGLSITEERKLGIVYPSLQCGTCGLIVGKPDSSD